MEEANNQIRLKLIERTADILRRLEHGCTDGNCDMLSKPIGSLHTNGGCKCWKYMADDYLHCATIVESMPRNKRCWTK